MDTDTIVLAIFELVVKADREIFMRTLLNFDQLFGVCFQCLQNRWNDSHLGC